MVEAMLIRDPSTTQGTPGVFIAPGFWAYTLELPWQDNRPRVSCIPPGSYVARLRNSPKFGRVYEICDVPGRSDVLIHAGNFAGDRAAGLVSHVEGCVLLGKARGILGGQRAVLLSRPAVRELMSFASGRELSLEVMWKS